MDLTQLANLGEFIGGVAVLVTLVDLELGLYPGTHRSAPQRRVVRQSPSAPSPPRGI